MPQLVSNIYRLGVLAAAYSPGLEKNGVFRSGREYRIGLVVIILIMTIVSGP